MIYRVVNVTRGTVVASRVGVASSFLLRLKGLLGRSALAPDEGLHLTPCNAVHMWFMRFPIGAVFLDRQLKVVKVLLLRPWHVSGIHSQAHSVLELHPGAALASATGEGDQLQFEKTHGMAPF